jgi:TolB-like protein
MASARIGLLSLVLVWLATGAPAPAEAQESVGTADPIRAGASILVLPFRNISGDLDTDWVGDGIAEALVTELQTTAGAEVIGRNALATALGELGLPNAAELQRSDGVAVAKRAGADWLIHGGYQRVGAQIRITAQIVDCETGEVARTALVDGLLDDLFALQDQILPSLASTEGASAAPSDATARVAGGAPRPPGASSSSSSSLSEEPRPAATAAPAPAPGGGLAAVSGVPPPPIPPATASRNAAGQVTVRAVRLTGDITLDGVLDEEHYRTVESISDFIQIEPAAGEPATEKTEVWLAFDNTNFYISARAWHSAPESEWIANEMRRDSFTLLNNENISFLLDTFYDRRNGVLISVNPIGGRMDGQVTNERDYNGDWNPIWDVRTGRFEGGWTFEAEIPFKSLRYRSGRDQIWGVQLRRNLQSKNENAYLTRLDRGLGRGAIFQASQAATLVGVEVPSGGRLLEVKPYLIGDVSSAVDGSRQVTNDLAGNVGLDVVKLGVTENLTADFTVNTDFAQVEADTQQVNLTRFSLFFPEKREFFLENQGVFAFGGAGARGPFGGSAETPILFYSRRIGLSGGREVPIDAGGRLTGRVGKFNLGLLNIQTGDEPVGGALGTNFTVARLKRDFLRRSSLGAIVTNRTALDGQPGSNQAVGVDGAFAFYDNVLINTYWARTRTTDEEGKDSSYKGELRYNGDRYGVTAEHVFVDERFSPGVGFIRRPDLRKSFGELRFSPRPESIDWIRRFSFDGSYNFITDAGGTVETREAIGSAQVEMENSDQFSVFYTRTYDLLQEPFAIASDVTIPIGGYDFSNTQASYSFGPQRRLSGRVSVDHGSFYGGTKTALAIGGGFGPGGAGRIELSPRFSLEPGISINRVELPQGNFTTNLVTTRTTYTFTPTMFVSALVQYNSSNNALSSNVRLRWEYQPGSELFVVYNEQRDTLTPQRFPELENRAFIIKFNRLFRF